LFLIFILKSLISFFSCQTLFSFWNTLTI
jgi:hypothetical protein